VRVSTCDKSRVPALSISCLKCFCQLSLSIDHPSEFDTRYRPLTTRVQEDIRYESPSSYPFFLRTSPPPLNIPVQPSELCTGTPFGPEVKISIAGPDFLEHYGSPTQFLPLWFLHLLTEIRALGVDIDLGCDSPFSLLGFIPSNFLLRNLLSHL